MRNFSSYLDERKKIVDRALDRFLPPASQRPTLIHKAMRYSITIGGKRIRPILCMAACEAAGGSWHDAIPTACALEMIHTYSLIHDDLPCMDNDDLRRGKPTSHKVFGEGIAVLAGDALLTMAFELLARGNEKLPAPTALSILGAIANASGSRNLIGGQTEDLLGEGKKISLSQLRAIHRRKTSALIEASVHAGALVADATPTQLANLLTYGRAIGLAFQVADDLLDAVGDEKKMGKRTRKDAQLKKATYPCIVGLKKTRDTLKRLTHDALESLHSFRHPAAPLRNMAIFLASRDS